MYPRPRYRRRATWTATLGSVLLAGVIVTAPQASATEPLPCEGVPGDAQTRFETNTGPRCFEVSDGSSRSVGTMSVVTFYAGPFSGLYGYSTTGEQPCDSSSSFMPGEREVFPVPRVVCSVRIF